MSHRPNAADCQECEGCQYRPTGPSDGWCYMFNTAPTDLPCSQHDQFAVEREIAHQLLRKNPMLLMMLVIWALDDS